jgi:DNA-directed RNA polymerase specialized sigma24 family protein
MMGMQTGGAKRHWLFDHTSVDEIPQIASKLVHYDTYFDDEEKRDDALTFVLEYALEQLPDDEADAVRIMVVQGSTLRAAGRELGIDHKTVKARAARGVEKLRAHLARHPWIVDLLENRLPADELPTSKLEVRRRFGDTVRGSGDE